MLRSFLYVPYDRAMTIATQHETYTNEYRILRAIELITQKLSHLEDEPKPTLLHCVRVGVSLFHNGYAVETVLAGFLHNCIEDSDVSFEDIQQEFGKEVALLVQANTVDPSIKKQKRKNEVVERCIATSKEATIIMAVEILDGLEFYQRVNNTKQLQNKIAKAQLFLEKNTYSDKAFDQLVDFMERNNNEGDK